VWLPGDQVKESLKPPYQIAAQNSWARGVGAYTGEIAPELLVDLGIGWVILGHSERRSIIGESSELVSASKHFAAVPPWTHGLTACALRSASLAYGTVATALASISYRRY